MPQSRSSPSRGQPIDSPETRIRATGRCTPSSSRSTEPLRPPARLPWQNQSSVRTRAAAIFSGRPRLQFHGGLIVAIFPRRAAFEPRRVLCRRKILLALSDRAAHEDRGDRWRVPTGPAFPAMPPTAAAYWQRWRYGRHRASETRPRLGSLTAPGCQSASA